MISPMLKKSYIFIAILTILSVSGFQSLDNPQIYITSTDIKDNYVSIKYEINYPGFVEIHLINPIGKKIWIKGKVDDKAGEHEFRIARKPMEDGKRYTYILKYKGKEKSGSFYNR